MGEHFEKMSTEELLAIINLKSNENYTYESINEARVVFAERMRRYNTMVENGETSTVAQKQDTNRGDKEEYSAEVAAADGAWVHDKEEDYKRNRAYDIYVYIILPGAVLWSVTLLVVSLAAVLLNYTFASNAYILTAFLYAGFVALSWYGILNFFDWGFVLNRGLLMARILLSALRIFDGYRNVAEAVLEFLIAAFCVWILFGISKLRKEEQKGL
jgi:hypothetical protein